MKKRFLAILTAIMLVMTGAALGEAAPAEVSGDFTGTAKGFGGDVTVTVTLTDGAITAVTAEGAGETEGVGSKAIELMPADMSESGSIAVDTVAGATINEQIIVNLNRTACMDCIFLGCLNDNRIWLISLRTSTDHIHTNFCTGIHQ